MKSDTSEYLPQPHDKIFELKKAEDPDRLLAIRLREQVCDDPNISDGAVRLFVRLLDMALNSFLNNGKKGKVVISQADIGKLIHCDERTVRRRTGELVMFNYLWTSLMPRRNTKPITIYHVTEFFPKRQTVQDIPGEGVTVNGKRRFDHGFVRTGKEATGQNRRVGSGLLDRFGNQIFFNLPANAPLSGQNAPLTPVKIDRSERTVASSARGQICPLREDSSVLSQRSKLTARSGQNCPLPADAGVRPIESQIESEGRKVHSKSISKGLKPASVGTENKILEQLAGLACSHDGPKAGFYQYEKFGGQWRARLREDGGKFERVLAEVRSAAREGTITGKVGEYFNFIWHEFASKAGAK